MPSSVTLTPGDHAVHFYEAEADLVPAVVAQLLPALAAGEPAVLLTTAEHRAAFEASLRLAAIDAAAAESAGLLTWGDAHEVAGQIVRDGTVDGGLFESVIAPLVRAAAADGRPVHTYGEVVAVLWGRGDVVAALELEQCWNALIAELPVSLLCGYPIELMTTGEHIDGFPAVCAQHTRLLGGAPVASPAEVSRRFPGTPLAVRHARIFVTDTLLSWGRADLVDPAGLVVTELAANAVRHVGCDFSVSLLRRDDVIRVAVGDRRPDAPTVRTSRPDEPHGRGLLLISGVSARWGTELVDDGKVVWAELTDELGWAG
jgi:hypothetical protein